jgi:hypothetical protein
MSSHRRLSRVGALLLAVSALALVAPSAALAQDPRDARITALESKVDQLSHELTDLKPC